MEQALPVVDDGVVEDARPADLTEPSGRKTARSLKLLPSKNERPVAGLTIVALNTVWLSSRVRSPLPSLAKNGR